MSTTTQLIIAGGLLFWLLTCLAIFDIARKNFDTMQTKAIWGAITLIPFIGPVTYFLVGCKKGTPKPNPKLNQNDNPS